MNFHIVILIWIPSLNKLLFFLLRIMSSETVYIREILICEMP